MRHFFIGCAALVAAAFPCHAQADSAPGAFDFYVLALSWSPTFCAVEGNPNSPQCRAGTFGFIVHGLWPQYEKGYPENCRAVGGGWVSDSIIVSMRDIMPSGGLIGSQWRKHGACSGLDQSDYFQLIREAYDTVKIPKSYRASPEDQSLTPGTVETAFIDANPGMTSGGIAVTCRQNALLEVRICLTKDLAFRDCREVNQDSCRAPRIDVPAVD